MNSLTRQKRLALGIVVVSVAIAAAGLTRAQSSFLKLGIPGLRMVDQLVFDTQTNIVNTNTVALPNEILGLTSTPLPVTMEELGWLPKDTTYGRRRYESGDHYWIDLSIVLMGTDRTSIHKPQVCLTGQGWQIDRSELLTIPISRPHPYELPLMKLTASKKAPGANGWEVTKRAIFVYWFVCDGRLTAKHGERMWWMAADLLRTGVLDRWAYVSYYSVCDPGQEEATFERMQKVIAASVPEFQVTSGAATKPQASFPPGNGG